MSDLARKRFDENGYFGQTWGHNFRARGREDGVLVMAKPNHYGSRD